MELVLPPFLWHRGSFHALLHGKLNYNDFASLQISSSHFSLQYIVLAGIDKYTYLKHQYNGLFQLALNHLMLAWFLRLAYHNPNDEYIINQYSPSLIFLSLHPLHA